ncbi:MAG: carboxy terminal-processing peptidase, partial [Myxococcota bacterium]
KRGRPATAEERDAIFLKLLHFQLSNYLSAGEPLEEARRLLRKRYDLRVKRFQESSKGDVLADFLNAFASALDPHSNYFTAGVLEDFRIQMSLSLEGIGVALMERDGYSVVDRVIPGGAASKLGDDGLQPKDKIIAVAEEGDTATSIIDMPLREAVKLIRGTKGTTVELTVLRQEGDEVERFPLSIMRDKVDLAEQAAKLRFEERVVDAKTYKLAIIELPSFYGDSSPDERQCSSDIAKLLVEVQEAEADGLLLDLSRNGGGLLEHAVEISGFFIRKGEIVGVQDARGRLTPMRDPDNRILYSGPLVVHTSRMSASASEILAGALKDYRRAVITGDAHTFGKGTVQTVTPLPPGQGALKITTAVFFRPGGKSTQKRGVAADIVIPTLLSADDTGEIAQPFALPGEEIGPFLSSYANAISPEDRWSRINRTMIGELARRSQKRLDESEEFAELRERIAEVRESEGLVRLADLLKRQEEAEAKKEGEDEVLESAAAEATLEDGDAASPQPETQPADGEAPPEIEGPKDVEAPIATTGAESSDDDRNKLSPQVEEALNVLGDLIALSRSGA